MGIAGRAPRALGHFVPSALIVFLLFVALLMIFLYAPTEASMRDLQRILYLHVAVTWSGLGGCVVMGLCGAAYLAP